MAEGEDLIVDAARHVTAYGQALWQRHRKAPRDGAPRLADLAARLAFLLTAVHGGHWSLRAAPPALPPTLLTRVFRGKERPWPDLALPSCAGRTVWLPSELKGVAVDRAPALFRAMALQQGLRAVRREEMGRQGPLDPLACEFLLVLEAEAADAALGRALPGLADDLRRLREEARRRRPPLERFPPHRRALEQWYLARSEAWTGMLDAASLEAAAQELAAAWPHPASTLFKDWWTGDWPREEGTSAAMGGGETPLDDVPVRSARLDRRPRVRQRREGEDDDAAPGAFMVQTAQPHEHAEDPMGVQRPADRDADSAAEAYADSVSELNEARLVRTSQRAHEVLLSDDPPQTKTVLETVKVSASGGGVRYPEWDYRRQSYSEPGTTVFETTAMPGARSWVERTLAEQRSMLGQIRRQFERLRVRRVARYRQYEGDEIDIDACIEARADLRGGAALSQRLYRQSRPARRDTAIVVLVDVSGSTDGWVSGQRRIIDVEREALLPLSIALDSLGEPHAILAFSGEGAHGVSVRRVKGFDEHHGDEVALRIAGLEPERYTRAGAALRHACALLAERRARHRLLLLLSDGKPNDNDQYEGRYGLEDTRQAVLEGRQRGLSIFCLTVDRQAAAYVPYVFGKGHHALLSHPERLPTVLPEWLKRLLAT
ncbi:nitric oxide reductase activation protein NorD [Propionivibrio soli]|uniref:nitric oxide reductase activation protein NorD n=1 Tax=Propionivibrio soli TaxID=2976531 RepID=UPI0021E8E38B|nr:hypothetical protein [Propionivibrio soli]